MAAACTGASDPRLVLAEQRVVRLTINQAVNTVRYLFGDAEARALVTDGVVGVGDDDDSVDVNRRFPPVQDPYIRDATFATLDRIADHVASYVLANFAAATTCAPATDSCAIIYLSRLAVDAYRRQMTDDERTRLSALYNQLRSPQTVNGYQVTFTVEEATSYSVSALVRAPQMLWRWEVGDPALAAGSPAGIPLTDDELATQLAFFLTDQPPDDTLLTAARVGTLRSNLGLRVDVLLTSQVARDWLRTIVEAYFQLNQLPGVLVDTAPFPIFTSSLASDMGTEVRKFLDNALWNGTLTDLLLSRTAFLNDRMAVDIYGVPVPVGATATTFVRTTLPPERRSGLLTNAAFLVSLGRANGEHLASARGLYVSQALLCMVTAPGPLGSIASQPLDQQTSQQEVAYRAQRTECSGCHGLFDPYGLALDNYDKLGRYRTVDDLGRPIDAHATLPAVAGGGVVANAGELAQKLAASPAFTNCMARALLQYAMVDATPAVEVPLPPQQAGCATADVVDRYRAAGGKTFADLVRATAAAPAFLLRRAAP